MDKMRFGFELETIVGIKKDMFKMQVDHHFEYLSKSIQRIVKKKKEDKIKIIKIIGPFVDAHLKGENKNDNENENVGKKIKKAEIRKMINLIDLITTPEVDKNISRTTLGREVNSCIQMFDNYFEIFVELILDIDHPEILQSSYDHVVKSGFDELLKKYQKEKKEKNENENEHFSIFERILNNAKGEEPLDLFKEYLKNDKSDVANEARKIIRQREARLITKILNHNDILFEYLLYIEWNNIDKKVIERTLRGFYKSFSKLWDIVPKLALTTILNNAASSGTLFRLDTNIGTCIPPTVLGMPRSKMSKQMLDSMIWTIVDDGSVYHKLTDRKDRESSLIPTYKSDYNKIIPSSRIKSALLDWVEIVSPIISWHDLFVEKKFEKALLFEEDKTIDLYNNIKTSNHVHISMKNEFKNPSKLIKVCAAWLFFEPLFYAMVAPFRSNNQFCIPMFKQMQKYGKDGKDGEDIKGMDAVQSFFYTMKGQNKEEETLKGIHDLLGSEKYSVFNLNKVANIGSIEVRLKHGSNDSEENSRWVRLLAYFLMAAVKNERIVDMAPPETKDMAWKLQMVVHGPATMGKKESMSTYQTLSSYFKAFILRGMHSISKMNKNIEDDVLYVVDYWLGLINPSRSRDVSKWRKISVDIDWRM